MDRFSYIPLTSLTRFLFFIFCFSFFFFFLNLCFTLVTQNTSSSSTYNQHTVQLRSDFNTFVKRGRDVYLLTHVYGANALDDPWFAELTSWDFFFFFFALGSSGSSGSWRTDSSRGEYHIFFNFFSFCALLIQDIVTYEHCTSTREQHGASAARYNWTATRGTSIWTASNYDKKTTWSTSRSEKKKKIIYFHLFLIFSFQSFNTHTHKGKQQGCTD